MSRNTDIERGGDEAPGRKKSRFKALKSRLFGRLKRKDTDGLMKQSQSTSDVTAPEAVRGGYDSEEDFLYPKGTLSSRALSHDSIFLADQAQSSSEPTRVLSQENVHSKIKTLQLKLQQQNFRLGPPPLLITSKRLEDSGTTSDDDGLPHSPPEMSFQDGGRHVSSYKFPDTLRNRSSLSLAGTGSEEEEQFWSQPPSRPLSPLPHPSMRPSSPTQAATSTPSPRTDFSSPADFTPSLDTSAARHRMSVKPQNQRPRNKSKKQNTSVYRPRSESMHDLCQVLSEGEEEAVEGSLSPEERVRFRSKSTQIILTQSDDLLLLELQTDREHNMSPEPQEGDLLMPDPVHPLEGDLLMPDPEHPLPRSNSTHVISEDEDPEQTEPEVCITSNPLYLQPIPGEWQPEPSDRTPPPVLPSTLTKPTMTAESLEQSVTTERSRDEEQEKCLEEPEQQTEPHKQLESTEGKPPSAPPPELESETLQKEEQSVTVAADELRPAQDAERVSSREKRKSLVREISTQPFHQADTPTKCQPVAAPRVRKPVSDPSHTASLKRRTESAGTEREKEVTTQPDVVLRARVTPAGQESQMSMDNEKSRPNSGSFHFSISSARRRERNITNPEKVRKPVEPVGMAPSNSKDTSVKHRDKLEEKTKESPQKHQFAAEKNRDQLEEKTKEIPQKHQFAAEKHRDQLEEKTKEIPQKHQFAAEKRTSLRREIVPNSPVTRTTEEKTDGHVRDAKGLESQRKADAEEETRNAFGVTLRATSLSLKYRSEAAQLEGKPKRHSLEASYMRAISEDLADQHMGSPQSSRDKGSSTMRAETTNKPSVLRKHSSMNSDSGPTATVPSGPSAEDLTSKDTTATTRRQDRGSRSSLDSAEALNTETTWKSTAWERVRDQQQQQQQQQLTTQPASEASVPETPTPVQLRPLQKTASAPPPPKSAAKPSTLTPAPKPTARGPPDRPLVTRVTDRTAVERRCDGANMAEEKKPTLSRMNDGVPCGDHQAKENFKPGAVGTLYRRCPIPNTKTYHTVRLGWVGKRVTDT
ncbi:CRACD-like protein isoform X2 [Clupea harengus]|uniref:CRACD-like protein isoform X2 n=1 Tax=Clupea harengus TaxID=7950 RepID=A0A8M1K976_CLUHA|nr:CRACD-like protein isoform X2 [Clupea harengus]